MIISRCPSKNKNRACRCEHTQRTPSFVLLPAERFTESRVVSMHLATCNGFFFINWSSVPSNSSVSYIHYCPYCMKIHALTFVWIRIYSLHLIPSWFCTGEKSEQLILIHPCAPYDSVNSSYFPSVVCLPE